MPPATEHAAKDGSPLRIQTPCTFTQRDFDRFADLSGDHNPIHVDPHYAAGTAFGATVAHGMLLYSRLRCLVEQTFPGCALQTQTLMFPAPSYTDEALTLVLESMLHDDGVIALRMQVRKPDGRLGLDGTARINGLSASRGEQKPVQTKLEVPSPLPATGLPAFDALRVGDMACVTRCYRVADMRTWAALARQTGVPVQVPEPLIAAMFSYLLGEKVPGHGTNYLKQSMMFHAVARIDEPLQARVTVTRLRPDKALVNLDTRCTGEGGRALCSGEALVLFKC